MKNRDKGLYKYSDIKGMAGSLAFYPIDRKGYKNQGLKHNAHWTYEAAFTFIYSTGFDIRPYFKLGGTIDMWVYIEDRLVIDLGGVRETEEYKKFDLQSNEDTFAW